MNPNKPSIRTTVFSEENKIALESLAMDLKRVALGYSRGSERMAERFSQEVLKRKKELESSNTQTYLQKKLGLLTQVMQQKDKKKLAEDALMYSTMFQNYVLKL